MSVRSDTDEQYGPMVRRILRILKWTCLAATLLILAAFAVNRWTNISYAARPFEVALAHYHLIVMTRDPRDRALQYSTMGWSRGWPGRYIGQPGFQRWRTAAPWGTGTAVPLWMPLTAFGVLTIGLFVLDFRRRIRPGHCPACAYDRRGLAPGAACPECGAAG